MVSIMFWYIIGIVTNINKPLYGEIKKVASKSNSGKIKIKCCFNIEDEIKTPHYVQFGFLLTFKEIFDFHIIFCFRNENVHGQLRDLLSLSTFYFCYF